MLGVMIKNNLKLMLRSKWVLALVLVGPVLTIAVLSSAFNSIMNTIKEQKDFTVGYSIAADSPYRPYVDAMTQSSEMDEVTLVQYQQGEANEVVKSGKASVFVEFSQDSYTLYSKEEDSTEVAMTKYLIYQFLHPQVQGVAVPMVEKEFIKIPSSIDYYGKIELIYFLWCSMITLSSVIDSERKNRIQQRLKISPASNLTLYLAKWIPCFLAITLMIGAASVISTYVFEIHWGCLPATIGLFLLGAAAVSSFGVLLFYIIQNVAVTFGLEFLIVWVMGFLGGSFESYMYSGIPETVKRISPIYYMNRCLVEYQTNGSSAFTAGAVWMHLAIMIVLGLAGCLLMKRRMEER